MDVLTLKSGDILLCDATPATIQQGYTDPDVLRRFMELGVEVRSVQHLHMKVVIFRDRMWVGSMNASYSSKYSLREAGLMTKDRIAIREARDSMNLLGSIVLTPEMLPAKPKISRNVFSPVLYEGPNTSSTVKAPLHILYGDYFDFTKSEEAFVAKKAIEVKKQESSMRRSNLVKIHTELIVWDGLKCTIGDWVLWTDGIEAFPPGEIVYLAQSGRDQFIWLAVPETARDAVSIAELRSIFKKHSMRLGNREQKVAKNSDLIKDIAQAFNVQLN